MLKESSEDRKIIWNAITAYLLLFISILFLFNKKNKYLNNIFVASHTKVAFFIHMWFLLTIVIFIMYWLWKNIVIYWYWLNYIISSVLLILLFIISLVWIYKAYSWKTFKLWDIKFINKTQSLVDVTWDNKIDEKDKLTIILSYIPFLWYIVSWKNHTNNTIKSISKLNLIISLIITLFYKYNQAIYLYQTSIIASKN